LPFHASALACCCSKHPLASVRQTAEALQAAAVQFRRRVGRPFVLVIDSADRLARNEESDKVLGAMLAYARDWAQASRLFQVLLSSRRACLHTCPAQHCLLVEARQQYHAAVAMQRSA
jgi:hypothetical protein